MQVVVNQKFLDRRSLYARVGTWGGIAALTIGFGISFLPEYIMVSWFALILGLTAFNIGHYNSSRYVTRPREDEILAYGLKGLDHRFRLLNYMKETPNASHVLVGPSGVYPIHIRRDEGTITNKGNKWSRKPNLAVFLRTLFEGGLGNPTNDALREAGVVRRFLMKSLGEEAGTAIPITPMIVFSEQRVKLDLQGPAVPVFTPRERRRSCASSSAKCAWLPSSCRISAKPTVSRKTGTMELPAARQPGSEHCFVCGAQNPIGLHVDFFQDGQKVWTEFTPHDEHQGYPGMMHGGILYTLLDETVGRAAFLRDKWMVTARMQVRYRHPVPIGSRLRVEGEIVRLRGRLMEARGRALLPDGSVAAEASGEFMEIPAALRSEFELVLGLQDTAVVEEQPPMGDTV